MTKTLTGSIHLVRAWPLALGAATGWLWLVLRALFRVPLSLQPRPLLHTSARLLLAASALGVALGLALSTAELSSEQRGAVAVAILERFDRRESTAHVRPQAGTSQAD